jgi:hypothetical protein
MLESGDLGGKCADLNALFVGLARSVGLPVRDGYGVRIAKSEFGYKSLGLSTDDATKAQHCRAEVYLRGHGWVPVDPADVRKVVLEEPPGNLPLSDEAVTRVRRRLFGSWEMNWMAYNYGHEVELPGSPRPPCLISCTRRRKPRKVRSTLWIPTTSSMRSQQRRSASAGSSECRC